MQPEEEIKIPVDYQTTYAKKALGNQEEDEFMEYTRIQVAFQDCVWWRSMGKQEDQREEAYNALGHIIYLLKKNLGT